jgi:hypothetical protein
VDLERPAHGDGDRDEWALLSHEEPASGDPQREQTRPGESPGPQFRLEAPASGRSRGYGADDPAERLTEGIRIVRAVREKGHDVGLGVLFRMVSIVLFWDSLAWQSLLLCRT